MDPRTARLQTVGHAWGRHRGRPDFWYDDDGSPRSEVWEVARVLTEQGYDQDAIAAWFTTPNEGLPGRSAPVDLLPTHVGRVLALAASPRPCGSATLGAS